MPDDDRGLPATADVVATTAPPTSAPALDPPGDDRTGAVAQATPTGGATAQADHPFRLGNRPPLTGVRAFLIAIVLTYHSNFKTMPGAWATIQVFFLLSGFLITAMLATEGKRNGRISIKGFYSRRAVRLLPPLVLTIALMGIYAAFVQVADASQRIWGDSAAAMFYYADYRQAFGHAPFFGFLAQTWSLSIEEQFYFIWSLLMVAAVAAGRRRLAYWFVVVGIVLSVADRAWQVSRAHPFYTPDNVAFTRIYYAFDTRADALFLGCLLGLLASDGRLNDWGRASRQLLTVAAAVSAAFMVWVTFEAPLFREALVVWQLPATEVACAIILVYFVVCPSGLGSRAVGIGVLVFIGDLSYTLYLVHFPVFLAIQPDGTHWGFWPTELVRLAIVFSIGIASWFLIEKPLARWRKRSAAR